MFQEESFSEFPEKIQQSVFLKSRQFWRPLYFRNLNID